jgi:hypothetical protein
VRNIVDEVEILSGGKNDSLMDAQDLVDEEKHDTDTHRDTHFAKSGVQRGRDSHAVQEIDLENMEASLRDFFGEGEDEGLPLNDDVSSIGRRFGESISRVRGFSDDVSSVISGGSDIMSSISGLTSLSEENGSWFSKDKQLEDDTDVNDRMSSMNRTAMRKDTREQIGKFNPMMNAGNKLLMSQGASLGTINEMRKKENEVEYKQPNRKHKGNAVDLVKMGNRTKIMMDNEFNP